MKHDPDRCLQCGTLEKTLKHTYNDTPYWHCSDECYWEACKKYVPKEFQRPREYFDTDEWKHFAYIHESALEYDLPDTIAEAKQLMFQWLLRQEEAYKDAGRKLGDRLRLEFAYVRQQQAEKDRIAQEKEDVRLEEERLAQEEEERRLEPREIPKHIRLEHTHILAPSGSGKTQFIINNILTDHDTDQKPPAIIFIDPKGIAIETLSQVRRLKDHLVIVDPFQKPALSLFATQGRTPTQLISDFAYIFSTTNQDLTGKQAPCFSFCARLLFTLPNADLFTFLDLLEDSRTNKNKPPNPIFLEAIAKLPPVARRFFETDYYSSNYSATREQIKSRIWGVLENDTLAAILNAKRNKLDLAECIRSRKTVLIHTRMTQLKEAHQTFGRYMISLVQDAIQNRKERHPVYLIIDEFQEFADENKTPQMLRLIREYGGGVTIAHQNMYCREINDAIRNAISTNTSIKYAASPEGADLGYMAKDLRCAPDFLKGIHKSEEGYRFACFVRGLVPPLQHPFVIYERFGWSDAWKKMSDAEYGQMKSVNDFGLQYWPQIEQQRLAEEAPQKKQELKRVKLMTGEEYKSLSTDTFESRAVSEKDPDDGADPDDNKPSPWGQ